MAKNQESSSADLSLTAARQARSAPCCDIPVSRVLGRRTFLQAGVATLTAASIPASVFAAPSPQSAAETVAAELYASMTDAQRAEVCHDFNDAKRSRVSANWHVTKPLIDNDFYSDSQRAMIEKIVRSITSEEGYKRLQEQMDYDDGGLGAYSIAMFGKPGDGGFQWMLTGRHLTLRADGNTLAKSAFGGPIVYGHGVEGDPADNLFFYQTQQVNEVFKALDRDQAAKALLANAPAENAVMPQGAAGKFPGLAVGDMTPDQKALVSKTLATILAPYRAEDGAEAMELIQAGGGIDALRFAFYKQGDLKEDQVWDIWRIEGPNAVCHFRGAPHVHAYIHIAEVS